MKITFCMKAYYFYSRKLLIAPISSKSFSQGLTIFCYLAAFCIDFYKGPKVWNYLFEQCYVKECWISLFLYCGIVFCFVFIASLNSVSFWVISTSQRLRKLIEFWDQFISLHLCSLCSSFFWYVHFCYGEVIETS